MTDYSRAVKGILSPLLGSFQLSAELFIVMRYIRPLKADSVRHFDVGLPRRSSVEGLLAMEVGFWHLFLGAVSGQLSAIPPLYIRFAQYYSLALSHGGAYISA
jgi:hypothetical protein